MCKGQLDEVEQMKRCVSVLIQDQAEEREDEEEEDEKEAALETLCDLCDNLDNARDLMKLGGLEVCMSRCVCHTEAGVRWRAAELLACCAQNMPEVQLYLLQQGALHTLLQLTDHDTHPTVRVKTLYAVSCLVREQEVGLRDFLSHDGFSVLMRGMQSDCEKLRTKSAFLLLNLLTSHPEHRDTVLSMGMVQQLVAVLRSPHSSVHEHVLGVLCCLVEDSERGVCDCRDPSLGLEELLNQRIQELQGREESQEEVEFCQRLRAACFRAQSQEDNVMDR
ncbi:hsp70-binding protein 1 isoform X2 [Hemibagrus wyckioides]|nr:hsp70-binding protein 1 isoform X2 [Hemibagrus wyckioides]